MDFFGNALDLQRFVYDIPFTGFKEAPQPALFGVGKSYVHAYNALSPLAAANEDPPRYPPFESRFEKRSAPVRYLNERAIKDAHRIELAFKDIKQKECSLSDLLCIQKGGAEKPQSDLSATLEYQNDEASVPNLWNKKEFHNLRERFRRKKVQILYSKLQQLLPNPNPKKRLSVPNIVCRVLKYIPELRSELQKLKKHRDELLAAVKATSQHSTEMTLRNNNASSELSLFVKVYPAFGRSELLVTVLSLREQDLQLSAIIAELEASGMDILHSSSFTISESKIYHSIHVQMRTSGALADADVLQKRLLRLAETDSSEMKKQICSS